MKLEDPLRGAPTPLSVLDIFKIGVGPSSSHTMGPWRAAHHFVRTLGECRGSGSIQSIRVELFGSLAKTGIGHGTVPAVVLGLSGHDPVTVDPAVMVDLPLRVDECGQLTLGSGNVVPFTTADVVLRPERFGGHPNAMRFTALIAGEGGLESVAALYYSIGGGRIADADLVPIADGLPPLSLPPVLHSGAELLRVCACEVASIHEIVARNELYWRSAAETAACLRTLANVMLQSVFDGCHADGLLPGGLGVMRRAPSLHSTLIPPDSALSFEQWLHTIRGLRVDSFDLALRWLSCAALAVNEQNASYQRIVTAPTNGSAGVIPAVLVHLLVTRGIDDGAIERFLMVASEIGALIIRGATISAAEGGCQAEIGASAAMAAAALADAMGASSEQTLMAAEIALEHHLGLTCDPVQGLVQVPCIERNVMGATKALSAATLAIHSDPRSARVSFDEVVSTMWATAVDMSDRYKETSEAGLAVHVSIATRNC